MTKTQIEIIHNYGGITPEMIDGITRIVVAMAEQLNDPAERQKFEKWKEERSKQAV